MNAPSVSSALLHPGNNANATIAGNSAEAGAPTYGINRNRNASSPHSAALGRPRYQTTIPVANPYARLISENSSR